MCILGKTAGTEFNDIPFSKWIALGKLLGGREILEGLWNGSKKATIEDAIYFLFDKNGRGIPRDLKSSVCDADRSFNLVQPEINYVDRLARFWSSYPQGTAFSPVSYSAEEFEQEVAALRAMLDADPLFKNWDKGVWLPLVLPQIEGGDYGTLLENRFLAAVGSSYFKEFPNRIFSNYRKGELAGQVKIIHPSHERLVAKMQRGPVIGIFLPTPLQGFSITADREFADALPEICHLAGGFDFAAAMAVYPDVLARDFNVSGNDCAAVQWRYADCSLRFRSYDAGLDFGDRGLGFNSLYSGGLFLSR